MAEMEADTFVLLSGALPPALFARVQVSRHVISAAWECSKPLAADPRIPLQESADALAECPNYWIPRDIVEAGAAAARSPAEAAVAHLHGLIKHRLPDAWSGAEYWVQASNTAQLMALVLRLRL